MDHIGRYEVLGELGRGAMGVVYQAFDPLIRRPVAIKTIRLSELTDPAERQMLSERLRKESQTAGLLLHPNIVAVHDLFEQGDMAYLVMEFVNGPSLARLLAGNARPNPAVLLRALQRVAAGLDFAHAKGVVHRDIKPANILIHEDGTPKISDFGLARIVASPAMTKTGMAVGSPSYMAPEQIQGQPAGGRADQFSLAVTAYEGLTGKRPFEADTLSALFYKILTEPPPSPTLLNPELGTEVEAVFRRALAKDAQARYPSCSDFIRELSDARERRTSVAAAPAPPPAVPFLPEVALVPAAAFIGAAARPRSVARLRWRFNRVAIAAPVLVVAALTGLFFYTRPETAEPPPSPSTPVAAVVAGDLPRAPESLPLAVPPTPAQPEQTPARIRAGERSLRPRLIREVAPVYPALARQARIQGVVRLRAVIGTNGRIHTISLVSGHPLLVPAAMDAVRQRVYQRALVNGHAAEVETFVDVEFTLKP